MVSVKTCSIMDLLLIFKFVLSDLHKLATLIFIFHIITKGSTTTSPTPDTTTAAPDTTSAAAPDTTSAAAPDTTTAAAGTTAAPDTTSAAAPDTTTAAAGTTAAPDTTSAAAPDTTTAAAGTTAAPDTTSAAAPDTTTAAADTTAAPDTTTASVGTTAAPDTTTASAGTTAAPDTTTTAASTTAAPDTTTTAAPDTTTAAASTTAAPDTTTASVGTPAAPDTTTASAGTTAAPDTTTASAGTTAAPDTTTTAADTTAAPDTTTTAAPDTTTTAADTTAAPDTTTTAAGTTTIPDATTTGAGTTAVADTTVTQDQLGINLTYPLAYVQFSLPENTSIGFVNKSVAAIILTTTGVLDLKIDPRYESTTDQPIDMANDVQVFSFTETDSPYYYLFLGKSLDYEKIDKFSLLVTLSDTNVTGVSYTVTFDITITDVNDVAPVILNLPENVTLTRDEVKGHHIYTINSTDADGTVENQVIAYRIVSGNEDGIFSVDNTSGEVKLIKDANQIPPTVDQYSLNISAYSGNTSIENSARLIVIVPNNAPNCTHDTVWANSLDINTATVGTIITFFDSWSCSDVGDTMTYSIVSVSPNLTSAFTIDSSTGTVSLLRTISSAEVPNRQFMLDIAVKDTINQTVTFSIYMNVTTISCLPNPRNLYVRMDQELGGVILDNFNCTVTSGLTFSMTQYPVGTFEINDKSQLILRASVVKIKFYSLSVTITHGSEEVFLKFQVIIQTRRCGVAGGISNLLQQNKNKIILFVCCWTILWKFFFTDYLFT